MKRNAILILLAAACAPADQQGANEPPDTTAQPPQTAQCDVAAARSTVARFGAQLRNVSVLAPDSVRVQEMRRAFGDLVSADLLDAWIADPANAPGRQTSNPWPRGIEITDVSTSADGKCVVTGDVIEVASTDTTDVVARRSVQITLGADGMRITSWQRAAVDSPADVITRYYNAIAARDYRRAYALWGDSGRSSGQTYEEFARGFENTATVTVEVGAPGRIEGAAGSQYVEVPVVIRATTRSGEQQRFEGTYTLRRSNVDGATPEQRRWHIHSADISEV